MLERIRARGVSLSIGPNGRLVSSGAMSESQRQYLAAHEPELLALLVQEQLALAARVRKPLTFEQMLLREEALRWYKLPESERVRLAGTKDWETDSSRQDAPEQAPAASRVSRAAEAPRGGAERPLRAMKQPHGLGVGPAAGAGNGAVGRKFWEEA